MRGKYAEGLGRIEKRQGFGLGRRDMFAGVAIDPTERERLPGRKRELGFQAIGSLRSYAPAPGRCGIGVDYVW